VRVTLPEELLTVYETQLISIPSSINRRTLSLCPKPQASQKASCLVAAKPMAEMNKLETAFKQKADKLFGEFAVNIDR